MRTILHIGQQKTGTTALQHTLVADRERLAHAGICYPNAAHERNVHGGLGPSHNALFFALQGMGGPRVWQSLDEIRADIERQVAETKPDVLLISSEHAIMAADQRADILGGLDQLIGGHKEIVVYLRRPDRFLTSFHKQLIRLGRKNLHALHTAPAMDVIEATCQIDHRRALQLYIDRYSDLRLFDYEQAGDTIAHFYRHVLQIDAPTERPVNTNPSIPSIFADLALEQLHAQGQLTPPRLQAVIRHGEREAVDLLGSTNRARLVGFYGPQNAFLGSLVGRSAFFADLSGITDPRAGTLSVEQANDRYRVVFDALTSSPTVHELRRDCRLLESIGNIDAAAALFDSHKGSLDDDALETFSSDLAASSRGELSLVDNHYRRPGAAPERPTGARRIVRGLRRRARAALRRVRS